MATNPKDILAKLEAENLERSFTGHPDISNRNDFFRTPFTMDCVSWRAQTPSKSIVFRCNPNKVDYEWPIRGATQNVKSGKVFYWWRNRAKQSHFEVPSITFSFQSGNIMVLSDSNGAQSLYVPEGLDNYYQFMALYDEVKMLADGTPNFVTITHHTPVFPNLTLEGFFDVSAPISVSESTEDAAMVTWSAKFLVHRSTPRFNNSQFMNTFSNYFISSIRLKP